jgi:hypothetical protein
MTVGLLKAAQPQNRFSPLPEKQRRMFQKPEPNSRFNGDGTHI